MIQLPNEHVSSNPWAEGVDTGHGERTEGAAIFSFTPVHASTPAVPSVSQPHQTVRLQANQTNPAFASWPDRTENGDPGTPSRPDDAGMRWDVEETEESQHDDQSQMVIDAEGQC